MQLPKLAVSALYLPIVIVCCGMAQRAIAQAAPPAAVRPQLASPGATDSKKAVLDDTEHLLLLARELKANVDKTRRDELSMRVIREADELEKLARSVKARIH